MSSKQTLTVPHNFTPRQYQLELYQKMDSGCKRAFLRWHRRAGKDLTCWCYMVKEAVRTPGIYYYFFPTYQQGRMALWENVSRGFRVLDHLPKQLIKRVTNQDMMIELTNGSVIRIVGTDNIDRVVGTNPIGCVFSEYSLQDPAAWIFISPILAENGGWAIFNGTPRGRNHMYKLEQVIRGRESWYISALTVEDTGEYEDPNIRDKIEEDLEMHGEDYVQQEYWVSYSAGVKGAFYSEHMQRARQQGRVGRYAYDAHRWVDTFWDLGVDDSTAIWFRQIDGNRLIFIDYFEDSGKDIAYYVKILQDKGYNYRTHYLPHDGGNRTIQTQFRTDEILRNCLDSAGLSADVVCAPKLPVQDGINAVRARFSRYFFDEGLCADGIEKLELYHRRYDTKRQTYLKEPVHDWTSHCADALRTEALVEEFGDDPMADMYKPMVIDEYDIFDDKE